MTAIEFLNLNVDKKLIVSYRSTANPQWKEIAYCPQYYDIPIQNLEDMRGEVIGDKWIGDDYSGNPHDFMGNSVTQIAIEPNPTEWERQIDEYESEAE
jgi:hypothetical protein